MSHTTEGKREMKERFVKSRALMSTLVMCVVAAVAAVAPLPAHAQGISDYLENRLIDWLLRGQAFTPPATLYAALATTTGSDAACGTEPAGGSYARASISSNSLTAWLSTQGNTSASTGTGAVASNAVAITWATSPTAPWGTVTEFCMLDAPTGGNLLWRAALTTPRTIGAGATVSFPTGFLQFRIDTN